ncbi:sigma-70 family RNA polymerase sigma factor [Nocardioides guangzhouensis]|uniref:Sigma-70 family RNA polymerase sigma factor n=1 Tax=Nocardioides guangzhouensis TaxID=2497878 RepID=A0A4Q4Z2J8_9ACTN|nr:sigma-70 family RNA polymerase sigma factor [Nocardioides guangzhouensis]
MVDELTEEVLADAARGDQYALGVVYRALAPTVQAFLLAHGAEDPEDLTNEVFLHVLPRLSALKGGVAGVRTFVFSVAHARSVDEVRRRARRPRQAPYDPDRDRRAAASAEHDALDERASYLRDVLAQLNDGQRSVITLRVLADLSVGETARVLGRSPGAVKQLQRRGLLALREILEGGATS